MGELGDPLKPGGWELRSVEVVGSEVQVPEGGQIEKRRLFKPRSPKSREVTRLSRWPQRTPVQRQQSVPALHDRKATME
jgi:hypothetical protein